jgi:glycosyltransferase involved in cell wall biosynthesis
MNLLDRLKPLLRAPRPDPVDPQAYALECFSEARRLMDRGAFGAARRAMGEYRRCIDWERFPRNDRRSSCAPQVSVAVVTWQGCRGLLACLESLLAGCDRTREIIVVDNGGNESVHAELARLPLCHLVCPANLLPSEGRNVAVSVARGPIVAFVDDDALVAPGYVASLQEAFGHYEVVGIRGRVLPPPGANVNAGIDHYDPGDQPMPYPLNTEGNSAFLREAYVQASGMDPLLFGHEGVDLSCRLAEQYGLQATMYWPQAIIYHDYADNEGKRSAKSRRHALMWRYLVWKDRRIKRYGKNMRGLRGTLPPARGSA